MNPYQDYTIHLTMNSSIITPFQSDTIFGHICWAVHHLKWDLEENRLEALLKEYDAEPSVPPLLISNGFPKGYLPKPILPPIKQDEIDSLVIKTDKNVELSYRIKAIKNLEYILKNHLKNLLKKGLSNLNLFEILFSNYDIYKEIIHRKTHTVQRNTINRIYSTVTQGLYTDREWFFTPETNKYEIYLKTNYFTYEDLCRIFDFISIQGFGKNKSSGKGAFSYEIKEGMDIPESDNPNAFMTLSSYIPRQIDPTKGYYHILHKFGKLAGSHRSTLPETGKNPFKVPLIMLSAGSVFKDTGFTSQKTYGALLDNVHRKNEKIRQYAYAFPIGIRLKENDNGR